MIGDTIQEINARNRAFWKEQTPLMRRRITDPVLLQAAMEEIDYYRTWSIPFRFQKSFESLLEQAETVKRNVVRQQAQKGGKAKKPDALQQLIVDLLRRRPTITALQLLEAFERDPRGGVIVEIDEGVIHFVQPDGTADGKAKKAAVSGLKDRLARAKKKLDSR